MASIISHNPAETLAAGSEYARALKGEEVFALCGDLGAGKTHFVKGLASGLGVAPESVTSPTFTIIHEYVGGRIPLYHFDLYRIESEDELLQLGLDDYLREGAVLVLEWADKFPALLPSHTRWLQFTHRPDGTREIAELEKTP